MFENYLVKFPKAIYKPLIKYRTLNNKRPVEKCHYENIIRNQRICQICILELVGDEYHYICHCSNPDISQLHSKLIDVKYT